METRNELTRRDFLKKGAVGALGLMAASVFGGSVVASAEEAGTYIPGTYSAEAKGAQGTVTVTMTFDKESITDVKVDVSQETPTIGGLHGEELEQAIMAAQSAHIDTITSATMTSTAARTAAAACIAQAKGQTVEVEVKSEAGPTARPFGYMCDEDWLGEAPVIDGADIVETHEADVVVVGGGHAGTQAALAAAQGGAKVAVLEKHADGEIIYRGDDICSYNSKLLESWGFGPYDLEAIVNEYVRRANGRCDTDVVRAFVYNSGEMMDNLASLVPETSNVFDYAGGQCIVQIGYNMKDGSYYPAEAEGYYAWASTFQSIGTQNEKPVGKAQRTGVSRLTELETYCRDAAEDLGAIWYCGHTSVVLTKDGDAVTGVIAKNEDGQYVRFNAKKAVILATGDFGANTDMVWQLCSEVAEYAERVGSPRENVGGMTDCDGSGHKQGCWAGGMIETHPRPIAVNCPMLGFGPWGTAPTIWLNCQGKRFMNEAMSGLALVQSLHQPMPELGKTANFAVMDKNYMKYIQLAGLDHGAPNWGYQEGMDLFQADMEAIDPAAGSGDVTGLEIANKSFHMMSKVYIGKTLEEALKNAGLSDEVIENTIKSVERYNELCKAGDDVDYCKSARYLVPIEEGPFYVSMQTTAGLYNCGLNTITGLVVNGNMQVLNADRSKVIPGLYAVGNCMGQRFGNAYSCPSAGNNMGNAMTTGRVAGKHAAAL
jgi:succinate dehydrogenase/fumarate reductase flavoprotein subunit/uncharacterized protein with FMN-binding domain